MANIVLGVSGSIAAYRAADLARDLMRAGHTVRACLTDGAEQFVTRTLFETLTGNLCLVEAFEEPVPGRMAHIDWARQADLLVIAPATANTINRIAFGLADDMLTTLALVFEGPMVIAPAMNPSMYANTSTQEAMGRLTAKGARFVEPQEGDVACGEHGQGKLAQNSEIVSASLEMLSICTIFSNKTILITSGPTQEAIDDVRFLSNRSSGKMGAALAQAALMMGAKVVVVSGPSTTPLPLRAEVVRVRSAEEMLAAALPIAATADWIIGAAAVADYRPANKHEGKLRRSGEAISIDLVPNPDVIAELAKAAKPGCQVVGFAAEPSGDLVYAREKMKRKGLAAIAHNDVSQTGIGFESDSNSLTLLPADREPISSGVRSKFGCAVWLLSQIAKS